MRMAGEQIIPASRDAVWEALNDPDVLRACIPGCRELIKTSDTEMTAVAVVKVGPIGASFQGAVRLSDLDPPNSYTITGDGKGGVAGFAKGIARVHLEPIEEGTLLRYNVEAQIGGKLAQLGARLIEATARKMADQFFAKFSEVTQARLATSTENAEPAYSNGNEPETPGQMRQSAHVQGGPRPQDAYRHTREPQVANRKLGGLFRFLNLLAAGVTGAAVVALWLRYSAPLPDLAPPSNIVRPEPVHVSREFVAAVHLIAAAAIGYLFGLLRQRR